MPGNNRFQLFQVVRLTLLARFDQRLEAVF